MTDQPVRTVMVLNSKGGSGKTTIATSLAGYYASQGFCTVLKDYDPQGSSTDWLAQRPVSKARIHGINAFRSKVTMTRSFQMRLPDDTQRVIIDSPAGIDHLRLVSLMRKVDKVVVPVIPSPIDIRASAMFIHEFQKFLRRHPCDVELAVVASRVPTSSRAFVSMQRIFHNLDIPLIARIRENESYIYAAEKGLSVLEMYSSQQANIQADWSKLLDWIEGEEVSKEQPEAQDLLQKVHY